MRPNDPSTVPTRFPQRQLQPSYYWGDELRWGVEPHQRSDPHNPMLDSKGRVWMTSTIAQRNNPDWCQEGSDHPSAKHFPLVRAGRQASYYDPQRGAFNLIYTCFGTHHLQFAEDADETLYFSGGGQVIGWIKTRVYDETGDEQFSQGWCPGVIDTNGDGKATKPWNEPGESVDPSRDTLTRARVATASSRTRSTTRSGRARPGRSRADSSRLDLGDNPPETCILEVYEPPSIENSNVDPAKTGYAPRGIDVDRNGIIWTALSGSGHMASFDRSKCRVLNGPQADRAALSGRLDALSITRPPDEGCDGSGQCGLLLLQLGRPVQHAGSR